MLLHVFTLWLYNIWNASMPCELNDTIIKELIILLSIWSGIDNYISHSFMKKWIKNWEKRLIWQEMCYDMIKCDDSNKQWLCVNWDMCQWHTNYSHNQMKLVDKGISIQRRIFCEKWKFYQEEIEDKINYEERISLMSLIVIQSYMKLHVMQGWRVGVWEWVSRN